nr:aminoglycoside phosphotransferase family protein [Streptomyces sp. S1D4-11]
MGEWLDAVPAAISAAGTAWDLAISGFHDAGHASVLATATDRDGTPLIIKAWPDRDRYRREIAALRLWYAGSEPVVRAADDDGAVATLALIGSRPGGAARPPDEQQLVADSLHHVHEMGRTLMPSGFPSTEAYVTEAVAPRIHRRKAATAHGELTDSALTLLVGLREVPRRITVLHGDLYRENVPFGRNGRPVLLDPVPMTGDAVFDWAFWIVYYRLGEQVNHRILEALRASGIPISDLLPWCVLLSLDGLLYYEESGDPRLPIMTEVLRSLLERSRRSV